MSEYRGKTVGAIRLEKPYYSVRDFCPTIQFIKSGERGTRVAFAVVETPTGAARVELGDWIIRNAQGEFYAVQHDVFEQTYEAIEEPEWEYAAGWIGDDGQARVSLARIAPEYVATYIAEGGRVVRRSVSRFEAVTPDTAPRTEEGQADESARPPRAR